MAADKKEYPSLRGFPGWKWWSIFINSPRSRYHAITFAFFRVSLCSLVIPPKKSSRYTPGRFFTYVHLFEYTPNPEELTSSSQAIMFRFYQKSSRVVYYHQTYRENHQTTGFGNFESTKVTWNRNQGGDCDLCFFSAAKTKEKLQDFFLLNQKEVIGLVVLEKMNGSCWSRFFLQPLFFAFFCFRFLIATGFCNCWFETVLKIFSVPKTSFLLWKSAIPKRNSSPNHHFLGAMRVLQCLEFSLYEHWSASEKGSIRSL